MVAVSTLERATLSGSTQEAFLSDVPTPVIPRYLRTPDAALHLGLSGRTLEKHRCFGTGPKFHKLGGRVVYSVADLDAWAARGRKKSTFDTGTGTVLPAKPVRR
jgi:predicted DNA-binding transcriptional regulator AlpA